MAGRTRRTRNNLRKFLEAIRKHGNVSAAAERIGVAHRTIYAWRQTDPEFHQAWEDAMREYATKLEMEADRRALDGTLRPIYFRGQEVGQVREYSDNLLMFRLKGLLPQIYKDRVEHSGDAERPVALLDATQRQARIDELLAKRNGHAGELPHGQMRLGTKEIAQD